MPSGQVDPRFEPHRSKVLVAPDHIESGTGLLTEKETAAVQRAISGKYPFEQGDVIYSKIRPYLRKAVLADFAGLCSADMYPLRPDSGVHPRFLLALVLGEHFSRFAEIVSMRSGFPKINRDELGEYTASFPPLPEQRRIAEILDTLDEAIRTTEQVIAKLQQMKQGLLHDLLTRGIDEHGELRDPERHPEQFKDSPLGRIPRGWGVMPLETRLARIIDYRGRTPTKTSYGVPLLTAKNVRDGYVDPEPREFIAARAFDSWMTRGIPKPGDVLFTTEAPLGNVAALPDGKLALAQRIITLVPQAQLDQGFLLWLLLWPISKRRVAQYSTGSTVLGIKQSVFRKIPFQFPPIPEQKSISAKMAGTLVRIENEETDLHKLRTLKHGLMDDLLTGRVRVTAPPETTT